jgi:hypothetical protein
MMKVLTRILSKTPKFGKNVRNAGLALVGLNASVTALPELPESWIVLANIILAVVMVIYGQSRAPETIKGDTKVD